MTLWGIELWAAAIIFARLGAMFMLMPGFGEAAIPATMRLSLALAVTVLLTPVLAGATPPLPAGGFALAGLIVGEIMIGLIFGGAARIVMTSLATAGQILGLESGLSFAQTADPTNAQVGQSIAVFFGMLGVALLFATNLHHLFLRGMVGTFDLLRPGAPPPWEDGAALAVSALSDSFRVALQISAPLLVAGFLFRLGLGALSRLIPTIQVFFVTVPLQTLGAFVVIALGLSTGMLVWLDSLERFAGSLG